MNNKIRLQLFFSFILALSFVMVASIAALAENETSPVVNLSLDQAMQLGLANNANLNLAQLSVDANKVNVDQTKFRADKLQNTIDKAPKHIPIDQDVSMVLYILPAKAQLGYDLAQTTLAYAANNIKYGIETAYYTLQVADEGLKAAQLAMDRNETLLKNVRSKLNHGLASMMELYSAQAGYSSSQANYTATKQKADYAAMMMNQLLGLELTTKLVLSDKLALPDEGTAKVEEAFNQALNTDLTYCKAKNTFDLAVLMGDYTQAFTGGNTFDYKQAEITKKQAEVARDNARTDLEIRVRYAYNSMTTALSDFNSLSVSQQAAAEAYRLAKLRFEAGLATLYDVQNAETILQQADTGLLNAKKVYNLAVAAFRFGIYPTPDIDD